MIVLIVIVGLLIGACWKIRRNKTFAPAEADENYGYATIDEVAQEVLTKANQAYAAAAGQITAGSFDNAGYEIADEGMGTGHFQKGSTFDKDAYEVIDDEGTLDESVQHKRVLQRGKAFDHDAYEVIDEEDNLGLGERTTQLTDMKDGSYENMDGGNADKSKMADISEEYRGQIVEEMSGAKDEQSNDVDDEYIKMDVAPCERTLITENVQTEAKDSTLDAETEKVQTEANDSTLEAETGFDEINLSKNPVLAGTPASGSFDLAENDAYGCNIAKQLGTYENTRDAGWICLEVKKTRGNPDSMTSKLTAKESSKMSKLTL